MGCNVGALERGDAGIEVAKSAVNWGFLRNAKTHPPPLQPVNQHG